MSVDKPTPGNLIATVSELVDEVNSGGSGDAIISATPFTTTTMTNPIAGGDMTVLVFPEDTAVLAWKRSGDVFPRVLFASDIEDGWFFGDGTVDPYNNGSYFYVNNGEDVHLFARHFLSLQDSTGLVGKLSDIIPTIAARASYSLNSSIALPADSPVFIPLAGNSVGGITLDNDGHTVNLPTGSYIIRMFSDVTHNHNATAVHFYAQPGGNVFGDTDAPPFPLVGTMSGNMEFSGQNVWIITVLADSTINFQCEAHGNDADELIVNFSVQILQVVPANKTA